MVFFGNPIDYTVQHDNFKWMAFVYRKHRDSVDDQWHFSEKCSSWPTEEGTYTESQHPSLDPSERLCVECVRLETPREKIVVSLQSQNGLTP